MSENNKEDISPIEWSTYHEEILIDWADKAKCYHWLHNRSQKKYYILNNWFTIPVIILSTATGTANFAQYRITNEEVKSYAPLVLGFVNIFTGIMTTVQQFLKISELNEAHRISALGWDKLYRNIKVELAKHPNERANVTLTTKACKEEMNRLLETSPDIDESILNDFYFTFTQQKASSCSRCCSQTSKVTDDEREAFAKMKKPDICGIMRTTAEFRHPRGHEQETQTDTNNEEESIQYIEYTTEKSTTEVNCENGDDPKKCNTVDRKDTERITLEIA